MQADQAFAELLRAHRSIRSFKPEPLPPGLVDRVLEQALHGTSSSGNLNMVSVVKTQDPRARRTCASCPAASRWCCRRRCC
jgi:nitroreductase